MKQKDLIDQLKSQLQDLESYAYESGNIELPSNLVMEKQKVIIDELKEKIHLPLDNLNKLSNEELKNAVGSAILQVNDSFLASLKKIFSFLNPIYEIFDLQVYYSIYKESNILPENFRKVFS